MSEIMETSANYAVGPLEFVGVANVSSAGSGYLNRYVYATKHVLSIKMALYLVL